MMMVLTEPTNGILLEELLKVAGDESANLMPITIDNDLCENSGCCAMVCPEDVLANETGRTDVID